MKHLALALPLTLAAFCLSTPALAQGGYRSFEFEDLGIKGKMAKKYEAIPTQPMEEWIVAQWAEQLPAKSKDRKAIRPEFEIVWIDYVSDPGPKTGEDVEEGEGEGDQEEEEETLAAKPINDLERYVEMRFPLFELADAQEGKECDGYQGTEYRLQRVEGSGKDQHWAYEYKNKERTIAFLGLCAKEDWEEQTRIWRYIAEKVGFEEPKEGEADKVQRYYERRPEFIDPESRIKIRSQLVKGWDFEDTENFIFVFSTKDQALLRRLKAELEAVRKAYTDLFPPLEPLQRVSTVRICKDPDEYYQYGGPQGSAGYWHPLAEELVFFDFDSIDPKGKAAEATRNTQIVLYHEAFHQYLHYACGQVNPHTWFNEGNADYFSGSLVKSGKVKKIGPNPWRVEAVQNAIRSGETAPLREFFEMSKAEYYGRADLYYPQGWSVVYFLNESREAQKRSDWKNILPAYFEAFQIAAAEQIEELGDLSDLDPEAAWQEHFGAGQRATEKVFDEIFEEIDIEELEEAWKDFILDLKPPK